jgi:hypothetical protein
MYVHTEYPMALQMAEDKFDKSDPHPLHLYNCTNEVREWNEVDHIIYKLSGVNHSLMKLSSYF